MLSKNLKKLSLLLLLGVVAAAPAFAGSAVIGSVAGSMNATIGGQPLIPNTTIFSGDSLQVNDGVAVVAVDKSSRMVFGRDTTASFLRDPNEVTVLLSRGNVSMYHPQDGAALRLKVGDVTVVPAKGFKTLGEVAMVGGSVIITAKEGSFRVEGNGSALEVAKGKTITLPVKAAAARAAGSPARPAVSTDPVPLATLIAAGVGAGFGVGALIEAKDAKDNAASATTAANAANTTAGNAVAAANAANATAGTANTNAIAAGCALNTVAVQGDLVKVSPFTPTGGKAPGC